MKRTLALALAVAALSAAPTDEAVAGGVTIHNYSGEPVLAQVGQFDVYRTCMETDTRSIRDGVYEPKSQYGFSGGYKICGPRKPSYNTASTSTAYYIKAGQSVTVNDNSGGYMQVYATTVKKGKLGGAGKAWHGGITQVTSPYNRKKSWVLCANDVFPSWEKRYSTPSYMWMAVSGMNAYDSTLCKKPIPFYWYTNTDQRLYDLVLTPENAKREALPATRYR